MQARGQDIVAAGCASCGAVVDTSDENYKLISKAMGQRDEKYKPRLQLGSKGTLEGLISNGIQRGGSLARAVKGATA